MQGSKLFSVRTVALATMTIRKIKCVFHKVIAVIIVGSDGGMLGTFASGGGLGVATS